MVLLVGLVGLTALPDRTRAEPSTLWHVQLMHGAATHGVGAGARRAFPWHQELGELVLSAHGEIEVGRWRAGQVDGGQRDFTQLSVAPVLQLTGARWFGEAGVGPTWLTPSYRSRQRGFSSRLQFRNHLAIGTRLDGRGEHTLDVRVAHVSNGGFQRPNPGLELLGVRYARRW